MAAPNSVSNYVSIKNSPTNPLSEKSIARVLVFFSGGPDSISTRSVRVYIYIFLNLDIDTRQIKQVIYIFSFS